MARAGFLPDRKHRVVGRRCCLASSAHAASCGSGGGRLFFGSSSSKRQAVAQRHIRRAPVSSALGGVTYGPKVIRLDRSQRSFKLCFEQFSAAACRPLLSAAVAATCPSIAKLLDRMEKRFGVPAGVVIAIWGLKTNYGSDKGGNLSIFRSLPRWPTTAAARPSLPTSSHERAAHRRPR